MSNIRNVNFTAFLIWLANTVHEEYDPLLILGLVTWPVFREIVQILIKPSPNPLSLGPGMVNCWEMMAGPMLPIQSEL